MSETRAAIDEAYKAAMKNRDNDAIRTLRLVNADLRRLEVDERKSASEAEVIQILQRNVKKRKETIEAAVAQGRDDIATAERAELAVLERFLPPELSEMQIRELVDATIAEVGATTRKEQGKVMSALMPKLQGRADGKLVASLVAERLA